MPTTPMLSGQEAIWTIGAADDSGTARAATFTATVSVYSPGDVYVNVPSDKPNQLHFVAKTAGNYTVTITGNSQDGTPLPADVQSFVVTDAPTPQATHFTDSSVTVFGITVFTPGDPGADHISGTL